MPLDTNRFTVFNKVENSGKPMLQLSCRGGFHVTQFVPQVPKSQQTNQLQILRAVLLTFEAGFCKNGLILGVERAGGPDCGVAGSAQL